MINKKYTNAEIWRLAISDLKQQAIINYGVKDYIRVTALLANESNEKTKAFYSGLKTPTLSRYTKYLTLLSSRI